MEANDPCRTLSPADAVRVVEGPWSGRRGVVHRVLTDIGCAVIVFGYFGRFAECELECGSVERLGPEGWDEGLERVRAHLFDKRGRGGRERSRPAGEKGDIRPAIPAPVVAAFVEVMRTWGTTIPQKIDWEHLGLDFDSGNAMLTWLKEAFAEALPAKPDTPKFTKLVAASRGAAAE
jgi:hypothetical protein